MSIFSIFKRGLEKSATKISRVVGGVFSGVKTHGNASFDDLESPTLFDVGDCHVATLLAMTDNIEVRDSNPRLAGSVE